MFLLSNILGFAKKKYYHDKLSYKYNSISSALHFANTPSENLIRAKRDIRFKSGLNFGSTYKDGLRLLGKPLINYSNPISNRHNIMLYKYKLSINKIKCEVHLYDNIFSKYFR